MFLANCLTSTGEAPVLSFQGYMASQALSCVFMIKVCGGPEGRGIKNDDE